MISLKLRADIFAEYPIIRSEITQAQKAFFDKDDLQDLSAKEKLNYLHLFDCDKELTPVERHDKIIGLHANDIHAYIKTLSQKLPELFSMAGADRFIILSHLKADFFGNRQNHYQPLVNAYDKLQTIVGQPHYNEAFEVTKDSLPEFIEILFWTNRMDPSSPEHIFVFDKAEQLQVSLCKYGNVHLTEYNKEQLTPPLLHSLKWKIVNPHHEKDNFSATGEIKNRKLKM